MKPADNGSHAAPSSRRASGARQALWGMLRQACVAAALTHVLFLLVFVHFGLPLLVGLNIGSVLLFAGARVLLLQRQHGMAISLIAGEVVLHAVVASGLTGWDSGFHYYLLTLVGPAMVGMSGSTWSKMLRVLAMGVGYAALDAYARHVAPTYRLEPVALDLLRYFNIAGMLAIMAFTSLTYFQLVISAERDLRILASTDALTGLHNRRHLLEIVRDTPVPRPAGASHFLLICDIDHFKQVNDVHGHETGDLVLEQVAAALKSVVRASDSVARWGGEEFVVLLPSTDLGGALQTAERIRLTVAELVLQAPASEAAGSPGARLRITLTVGVARFEPSENIDAAIGRADAALYRGKAAGRDRVVADSDAASGAVA